MKEADSKKSPVRTRARSKSLLLSVGKGVAEPRLSGSGAAARALGGGQGDKMYLLPHVFSLIAISCFEKLLLAYMI